MAASRRSAYPAVAAIARYSSAWTDVWICPFADGHLQATGRDARGRKQYRYPPLFRQARESTKYEHLIAFAEALPAIRANVRDHMSLRGLSREKVLATVVHLLETTLIRIGNDDYARQNNSYGLTTLKSRHVAVEGTEVSLPLTGKGGKQWSLSVTNRRVAKIVKACQSCRDRSCCSISTTTARSRASPPATSTPICGDYRHRHHRQGFSHPGRDRFGGCRLHELERFHSLAQAKRNLRAALERVPRAWEIPTICRKCYVHPEVLSSYLDGNLTLDIKTDAPAERLQDCNRKKPRCSPCCARDRCPTRPADGLGADTGSSRSVGIAASVANNQCPASADAMLPSGTADQLVLWG